MSTKAERDAALDLIGNLIEVTRRNWLSGGRTDCEAAIKLGVAAEIMAEVFAVADREAEIARLEARLEEARARKAIDPRILAIHDEMKRS